MKASKINKLQIITLWLRGTPSGARLASRKSPNEAGRSCTQIRLHTAAAFDRHASIKNVQRCNSKFSENFENFNGGNLPIIRLIAQIRIQSQRMRVERQKFVHFYQLEDVNASVFFGNVKSQHRHWVFAQHGPAAEIGKLEGVNLKGDVGNSRPLVRFQALNLESRGELWIHVLIAGRQNCRRQRERCWCSAEFDLKNFLARRFHENRGEKLRVRLHQPTMRSFFSLACESDGSSRCVDEASNKHSLTRSLSGSILRDFVEELVRSHHVAGLTVDSACEMK